MTKFMPFWFMDVVKTEEKLSNYASQGQMLTDFTPWGRFVFENNEPAEVKFKIAHAKNYLLKAIVPIAICVFLFILLAIAWSKVVSAAAVLQ